MSLGVSVTAATMLAIDMIVVTPKMMVARSILFSYRVSEREAGFRLLRDVEFLSLTRGCFAVILHDALDLDDVPL